MMFNYGIQSNSESLLKVMDKELLPLTIISADDKRRLLHPNIVRMYSYFVDNFPLLPEAYDYYPMAIPSKYDPDGYGRNKSLFIVMKRYDMTIGKYLRECLPTIGERLLLMTQLMEALLFLSNQSIVHRDLKSDNILVSSLTGELVVADFGCALKHPTLLIPYLTDETTKGGNLALMAPEVLLCQPGPQSYLDYRKSDLWSSGTICYELFSQVNPFFNGNLRNDTYTDQELPPIDNVPTLIENFIHSLLRKNPKQRPHVSLVSDSLQLYLWCKSESSSSLNQLYQCYMWTAIETLFNKRKLTRVELNLKKLFFQRQNSKTLNQAQAFLANLS